MKGKLFSLLSLVAVAQISHSITFSDGTFNDPNWSMVTFPTSATGQFTEQITAGGNPGAYKRVATINNNFTYNAHLRTAFTYNPSVSGAISTIDWSIEYKNFLTFGQGQGFYLVIEQGGNLYRNGFFATGLGSGWLGAGQGSLTEGTFTEGISGSAHPNFSASGSTITFGFGTSNGNAATIDIGYDNYSVTITPVPEPGTLVFLGVGAVAVLRRRKR